MQENTQNSAAEANGSAPNCAECFDQPSVLYCLVCAEHFCQVCCMSVLHRTGKRRKHKLKTVADNIVLSFEDKKKLWRGEDLAEITIKEAAEGSSAMASDSDDFSSKLQPEFKSNQIFGQVFDSDRNMDSHSNDSTETDEEQLAEKDQMLFEAQSLELLGKNNEKQSSILKAKIYERSQHIPMRLTHAERKELRLLEATLHVNEYTDNVDIISYTPRNKRIIAQLREICSILAALVVASDMKKGKTLLDERDFEKQAEYYKHIFEVGRRYKIMNPDRMRATYGKLMYIIQDSVTSAIEEVLGFTLYKPILTVYNFLEECEALKLLNDDLIVAACSEIIAESRPKHMIQIEIKQKERAIELLSKLYSSATITREEIRQALYSIGDHASYLRANRDPVRKMRKYLFKYFNPQDNDVAHSLSIVAGRNGARLTHSHKVQFQYVNQSLILWDLIMDDMFLMWTLTDNDLLSSKIRYNLSNTGQGLNRVQSCPNISRAIHALLYKAQKQAGSWIGSSAIHLGDHNVPNALMFIDKYLQVPRILNPVALVISELEKCESEPIVKKLIKETYNDLDSLIKAILIDFFRYAFDGSGADSFFDAGSCIDGRLTSAWNWANQIEKKPYYRFFLMAGFQGFDGTEFN